MSDTKRRKPGPKPVEPRLVEGIDYSCGDCSGKGKVWCPDCYGIGGCPRCEERGEVKCHGCNGGASPVQEPDWL